MAISTSSYFSNSLVGVPQVAGEISIYDVNSAPKYALGTKFERQDGAIFRYGHFSAATSAGTLMASTYDQVSDGYSTGQIVAPSSTYQMPNETPGVYPGAIGSRYFVTYITATLNQYAGAYMAVVNSSGMGIGYRIRGCTSTGVVATALSRFELYEPIVTALSATSAVLIVGNKYNDMKGAGIGTANLAGVAVTNVNTAAYFGWVQTRGICSTLQGPNHGTTIGSMASMSSGGIGTVQNIALFAAGITATSTGIAISTPFVGYFAGISSANLPTLVDLQIE